MDLIQVKIIITGESQTCNTFTCVARGHEIEVEGITNSNIYI